MALNTTTNVGIRRNFATLGDRNFEDDGLHQYKANREPFYFLGTLYHFGDTLSFDVTNVSPNYYSAAALKDLLEAWNQGHVAPLTQMFTLYKREALVVQTFWWKDQDRMIPFVSWWIKGPGIERPATEVEIDLWKQKLAAEGLLCGSPS